MLHQREIKQLNAILVVLSLLLFSYTLIRAYVLSITWDEAYTYIEFVRTGHIILDKYEMMSANNHILNTAGMIFFTKLFGLSEFPLRLPNIFAHFIFLFYSAKLVKKLDNKWLAVGAFVVLNVNPYMQDFFCLARGYGLSLGMMMASIYCFYLFCTEEKNKNRSAFISILFASFAVLSNFVLLNYALVLFGLLFLLFIYFAAKKESWSGQKAAFFIKGIALPTMLMITLLLFVIPIAFKLKEAGALFFGGDRSFWADTISTITDRCFYELGYNYWIQRIAKGFVFLILILSLVLVGISSLKKELTGNRLFLGSLLLMIGLCSLSTIVQHHFMNTPYLLDRTVLFLVVLFNLVFVFFVVELAKSKEKIIWISHFSALILVVHFAMTFNFTYVLEWKFDANTKEMLSDLERIKVIPKEKATISIGIPLTFDPAINFYREKNNLLWLNTAWRNETTNPCHDYFYLTQEEALAQKDSIEIIKTYPGAGNVLAKPKYPAKEIKVLVEQKRDFDNAEERPFEFTDEVEYGPTFSYIINDSVMPQKRGVFTFKTKVKAPDIKSNNLIMVISFQTAKGEVYSWQKAYLKDFIKNSGAWSEANFTCIVPAESRSGDEIKSYIWNPEKQALFVNQMEFKYLGYKF